MTIQLVDKGSDCVLVLNGRLDTNVANDVEKIFDQTSDKYTNITLDISALQYISSSGLRLVIKMHVKLNKKGGQLSIKNASPQVMEVFEMVGFTTFCNFI